MLYNVDKSAGYGIKVVDRSWVACLIGVFAAISKACRPLSVLFLSANPLGCR